MAVCFRNLQLPALVKTKTKWFFESEILSPVFQWYFSRYWNKSLLEQAPQLPTNRTCIKPVQLQIYLQPTEKINICQGIDQSSVQFSWKLWQQILSSHIHTVLFVKIQLFLPLQWTSTVPEARQGKALMRFLPPSRHIAWDKSQFFVSQFLCV